MDNNVNTEPKNIEEACKEVIEKIRPYLMRDGGDIQFVMFLVMALPIALMMS